jgi:hypothetical protein
MRRRLGLVVVIAAAVTALPGCWLQVGYGPAGDSFNPLERGLTAANATTLAQAWSTWTNGSRPIVDAGRVLIIGTADTATQGVTAVRADDGSPLWSHDLPLGPHDAITGDLAIVGDDVHAAWRTTSSNGSGGCRAGELRLDPTDGSVVALTDTTPTAWGTAVPVGDMVVQTSWSVSTVGPDCWSEPTETTLVARDRTSGDVRWRSADSHGFGLPVVGDGRVYVRYGQHLVAYALDGCGAASCSPLWDVVPTLDTPQGTFTIPDLYGTPMFASGSVFSPWYPLGGDVSGFVALDAATGQVSWSSTPDAGPTFGGGGLAAADGIVYAAGPYELGAFDADGCGAALCDPVGYAGYPRTDYHPVEGGSVVVAGGVVYASRYTNVGDTPFRPTTLVAFDAASCQTGACRLLWTTDVLGDAPVVVSDARLLASSAVTGLFAFAPTASP